MTKTIVCAGFYRTGSTWLFNAVKTILQCAGHTTDQTGELKGHATSADYLIHKVHVFSKDLADNADFIFTSARNISDCKRSFKAFTGYEMSPEYFSEAYSEYIAYDSHPNRVYRMEFYRMLYDKRMIIEEMKDALGIDTDTSDVLAKLETIKPPADGQDKESYYFSNHITNACK